MDKFSMAMYAQAMDKIYQSAYDSFKKNVNEQPKEFRSIVISMSIKALKQIRREERKKK